MTSTHSVWSLNLLAMLLSICMFVVGSNGALHSQIPSSSDSKVILEIVNRHFTVGKRIPSLYLRLFSDGTVECSTIKFAEHDVATTKKERLKPDELAQVTSILNDPSLRDSAHDYALQRVVFDSWMEWDITINRPSLPPQNITLSFAGGSGNSKLPRALARL